MTRSSTGIAACRRLHGQGGLTGPLAAGGLTAGRLTDAGNRVATSTPKYYIELNQLCGKLMG
jgi:hypothetical protein